MKQQGCTGAAANVQTAAAPSTQYVSAAQMNSAYQQVWGAGASLASYRNNCPASTGPTSCARSELAAYVRTNGTAILQTIAAIPYSASVGQSLDSAHTQTIVAAFGRTWTGAADLNTYLTSNPTLFSSTVTFGGLDRQGCLINSFGAKLSTLGACGNYFVDATGAHAPGTYPASLNGARFTVSSTSGGGVLVSNSGVPLKVFLTGKNWTIVAQGGGNIILNAGGNIVAQGGGNIVAQGGGKIVAQGGGNIVAQGGGNLINDGAQYLKALVFTDANTAARTARLIGSNGSYLINQDGNGFLPAFSSLPGIAAMLNYNGSRVINTNGSNVINTNGSNVISENSSGLQSTTNPTQSIRQNGSTIYSAQSLGGSAGASNPLVRMTAPAAWFSGSGSVPVKWTVVTTGTPCSRGFQVVQQINGDNIPTGPAVSLTLGMSIVPNVSWPVGTRFNLVLKDLCTNQIVSAPYPLVVQ